MIPTSYRQPVRGVAPLPIGATVGDLGGALDGQTANLERANGRTADVVSIADACQAQQGKVLKALQPPTLWERLTFQR